MDTAQECFNCGVSGTEVRLMDVIYQEGIVKACRNCIHLNDLTIIPKPTTHQLKKAEHSASAYERLSRSAGLPIKEPISKGDYERKIQREEELRKQNVTLKDLLNKRIKAQVPAKDHMSMPPVNLIDNFHWVIMRARRSKKLTHAQLGKEIGEAEETLKMVEQGKLPADDYNLIRKLENYLSIRIVKSDKANLPASLNSPKLNFDSATLKNLTLSDLHEMKKKKEESLQEENLKDELGEIEHAEQDVNVEPKESSWKSFKKKLFG